MEGWIVFIGGLVMSMFGGPLAMPVGQMAMAEAIAEMQTEAGAGATPSPGSSQLASAEARSLPPVAKAALEVRKAREKLLRETIASVDADLEKLAQKVDASTFADEAIDWNSALQAARGDSSHAGWLGQKFDDLILNSNELKTVIEGHVGPFMTTSRELSKAMYGWSSKPLTLHRPTDIVLVLEPYNDARQRVISEALNYASNAPVEKVGTLLFGMLVGAAVQSFIDDEESTTRGAIAAFAAEEATGYALNSALDTQGKLTRSVNAIVAGAIRSMKSGGSNAGYWLNSLKKFSDHEQNECEKAIGQAFSVKIGQALAGQSSK